MAILLFFTLLFTVPHTHDLRDICSLEEEEMKCKWICAGVYSTQMPIGIRRVIFERFFIQGTIDLLNQNNVDIVEIIQGTAKCNNVRAAARAVVIVNGKNAMRVFQKNGEFNEKYMNQMKQPTTSHC